jgi:outer membrane lipoprotein-sorting protein
MLAAAFLALAAHVSSGAAAPSPDLTDLLTRYNARIAQTLETIQTLRVEQEMVEPQADGTSKRAHAVLSYTKGQDLTRDEISSNLSYPAGEYTLETLVGPTLDPLEYTVAFVGMEDMSEHVCYRLSLTALKRDVKHIDGTVWVSAEAFAPVRIQAAVSDPPYPATEIKLDKSFELDPSGAWLLSEHVGEVEVRLLWATKRGVRHITYDDYVVTIAEP